MTTRNVTHFELKQSALSSVDAIAVSDAQIANWKVEAEKAGRQFLKDTVVSQFRHGGLSAGVAEFLSAMAKIKGESR
jgi:hypothetical protein